MRNLNKTGARILQSVAVLAVICLSGCAIQPGGYGYANSYYPAQQESYPVLNNTVPYYGGVYSGGGDWNNNNYGGDNRDDGEDH
jgi:hypothetical protein